jgi:hypothetical protein
MPWRVATDCAHALSLRERTLAAGVADWPPHTSIAGLWISKFESCPPCTRAWPRALLVSNRAQVVPLPGIPFLME